MKNEGLIYRISGPVVTAINMKAAVYDVSLLYTSPSPRDMRRSRMPSSA